MKRLSENLKHNQHELFVNVPKDRRKTKCTFQTNRQMLHSNHNLLAKSNTKCKHKTIDNLHTSGCSSRKAVVPPLAQSTGKFIDVPDKATACADWPLPITTTPANGRFSVC